MRPRVVGEYSRAAAQPLLDLDIHGVVITCSVSVTRRNDAVVLTLSRVPQRKNSPLVRIGSGGADGVGRWTIRRIQRARPCSEENRGIDLLLIDQVRNRVADIIYREQPVLAELSLNAQRELVYRCGVPVRVVRDIGSRKWEGDVLVQHNRQRISTRIGTPWI